MVFLYKFYAGKYLPVLSYVPKQPALLLLGKCGWRGHHPHYNRLPTPNKAVGIITIKEYNEPDLHQLVTCRDEPLHSCYLPEPFLLLYQSPQKKPLQGVSP